MVLKKSKHGINSGNTFHMGARLFRHHLENYTTPTIETTLVNPGKAGPGLESVVHGVVKDVELQVDPSANTSRYQPEYSLNKKKRWQIADNLKGALPRAVLQNQPVRVVMSEEVNVPLGSPRLSCLPYWANYESKTRNATGYFDSQGTAEEFNGRDRVIPAWVKPKHKFGDNHEKLASLLYGNSNGDQPAKKERKQKQKSGSRRGLQRFNKQKGKCSASPLKPIDDDDLNELPVKENPANLETDDLPVLLYKVQNKTPLTSHPLSAKTLRRMRRDMVLPPPWVITKNRTKAYNYLRDTVDDAIDQWKKGPNEENTPKHGIDVEEAKENELKSVYEACKEDAHHFKLASLSEEDTAEMMQYWLMCEAEGWKTNLAESFDGTNINDEDWPTLKNARYADLDGFDVDCEGWLDDEEFVFLEDMSQSDDTDDESDDESWVHVEDELAQPDFEMIKSQLVKELKKEAEANAEFDVIAIPEEPDSEFPEEDELDNSRQLTPQRSPVLLSDVFDKLVDNSNAKKQRAKERKINNKKSKPAKHSVPAR